ncbi:MFS transporter [Ideonella dechloratans]|uniref:MFS transporter n=1 Tax=Ideonella dechloratans TaxID=36863 RepID=A0A643FG86_IDEDE|nr:MFS transporter [Ideonella dechloratans]KAB0583186.1 MFS transporter [Ideonella dechloratans]UFU10687.1 MFS transporter [Ideonella dechloratans]
MRLPNLLATARGRLTAFFLLYLTEGIPLGFAATAVATQLRRQGVGPAEIGAFVGSFYLPWAFKWAYGPVVDVFASARLGRRRGWILGMQIMMVLTLLSTVMLDLPRQLGLFTLILLVHNVFSATQDVAIDALAVNTLQEHERATANGMMFAGASLGQAVGGSGALFVAAQFGFQSSFYFVCGAILMVTLFVVLPLKEAPDPAWEARRGGGLHAALREMLSFVVNAFRSFVGTRGAFAGLGMALLPPGAMCLGLALQSNLAVELGLPDDQVAWLNLWSTVIGAAGCVVGGIISDRVDRRKALNIYILLMSVPVLVLAFILQREGWITADANKTGLHNLALPFLVGAFWLATLSYQFFNGLMYSTTNAIYMDVTNPAVAATQFTAYMAMANLAISYSSIWQGIGIESWGYPTTMVIDGFFGLTYLLLLPLTRRRPGDAEGYTDHLAPQRARKLALGLALMCLAWLPVHYEESLLGPAQPIAGVLFSLIFVGSAVVLLAGGAVLLQERPALAKTAMGFSTLTALLLLRKFLADAPAPVQTVGHGLLYLVPVLTAALLWQLARRPWRDLAPEPDPAPAV